MSVGYKGFGQNLCCHGGFQYEIGKTFKTDLEPIIYEQGFHFCEHPFDVFSYYPPVDSRYCEVSGEGKESRHDGDSKVAVSKIKINGEIGLKGIIEAGIKFVFGQVKWIQDNSTTGDRSGAQVTGDRSGAQVTGFQSGAQATGFQSGAQATGYRSGAQATGYRSGAQATGSQSGAQATGDRSMACSNGYEASSIIVGECQNAVAVAIGYQSKAKASLGNWIVIAEWCEEGGEKKIRAIHSAQVDGKLIKADTFYCYDGEFKEV